ncbi:TetR/AcrR family transcriptional regulator [Streptomyces sp. KL116D]|uniref:TetR/AcrR family transcriptional regulator n=1 Tax=Streptomyces sp. KL116D TaxID=3045152 RepID=UPI00355926F3
MTSHQPRTTGTRGAPADSSTESGSVRARLLDAVERMAGDEYKLPRLAYSLREIAREVGIATPSIYRHFDSKEALVAAAVEAGFLELLAEMDRADADFDGNSFDRLHNQAIAYCVFLYRRRGLARMMFATHPDNWQPEHPLPNYLGRLNRRWHNLVEECQKGGFAVPGDSAQAAINIWSAVHGNLMLALIAHTSDEEVLRRAIDAHFDMLGALLASSKKPT